MPNVRRTILSFCLTALLATTAQAIETDAKNAILMDQETGSVLFEKNPDVSMAPASMSKLMTLYLLMERLKDGRLSLDDTFLVSENAWRKGGTKSGSSTMFLKPNSNVRIEDLLRGIIVQSGNDACITVAENISGSEEEFAKQMTERAEELGLTNSRFANATGWPDENQKMSTRDLALLARALIRDFPEYYSLFSEKSYTYNGIKQSNRNPLLVGYTRMKGADGLKTGHTEDSGYGLVGSVKQNGRRLISVVNGLDSNRARGEESAKLLGWGFREFSNQLFFKKGEEVIQVETWLGENPLVPLIVDDNIVLTLSARQRRNMQVKVLYDGPIAAPIKQGDQIGKLEITLPQKEPFTYKLYAAENVARLGFFGRLFAAIEHLLLGPEATQK